ncbi:gamma-glutamyltransferase family protein [Bradyrhizobium sp. 164]|uniref:gamma-glutamyltransferase family protein n=1 Tax=Bradyrhizobium sp. 164 TaxID=2782637 RepID=UPI001FF98194|nr:gamma-glutamyltransferase family protein [Bradyrhizobium sp. 164]MCK1597040.1 gamma-glutamyltransferase family protein [Bradyrhizobium sp. 164]
MRNFEVPGRSLAYAKDGMAATSHPVSTLTALEIMKAGGNAMDAAIAACAVQCVVEAGSTGIGGDCFALFSLPGSAKPMSYNGSGRTPAAAEAAWYVRHGIRSIDRQTPHAVTVPGAVEAWATLAKNHGRLPFGEILAPAVEIARRGYVLTPRVAFDLANQTNLLGADIGCRETFLISGDAPKAGSVQSQERLADTLELIGREGARAFYDGDVGAALAGFLADKGGLHTSADFASAKGEYTDPISIDYRGRTVYECGPNGQGIIALMIMKILSRFDRSGSPRDVDNLYIEVEATRLAYAARDRLLADPAMATVPVDYLLSDDLASSLAAKIDLGKAIEEMPPFSGTEHSDTVYICTVDKDRNAVSFINSLFHPYGAGLMEPTTGVLFHNRAQSFVIDPGHPNCIGPRKRPLHTIIPGMVYEGGRPSMVFGVMGGHYQAMGHAHFLARLYEYGLDLQSAMDEPRLFPLPGGIIVEAEEVLRGSIVEAFGERGLRVQPPRWPIGGAQAIGIDWQQGVLVGGSDHRKDGCALGY